MHAFIALVRKDLLQFLVDRRAVVMSLLAPVLIGAFFGSLFGGDEAKISQVAVAVADLDGGPLSQRLTAALAADPALKLQSLPPEQADALVRAGKLQAAITVPAGFEQQAPRALFGGPKPELVLTVDPSQSMVAPLVRGLLTQHAVRLVSEAAFAGNGRQMAEARDQVARDASMPADQRADLTAMFDSIARVQQRSAAAPANAASAGPGLSEPFALKTVKAAGKPGPGAGYDSYAHSFAGMGVQFVLLMGVDVGIALLTLRRTGLWLRLRAAPLSRAQLLGSRMASCALIAFGIFTVILAVAIAVFGVRVRGSFAGLVMIVAAFALVTPAFGLMIAALGRTPEATRGLAILATLLLVMLGGAWVPSFIFPAWLQAVAAWTPTHWAVNGLDAMTWRAQPFSAALAPTAVLLAFAAGFAALALARFRWNE